MQIITYEHNNVIHKIEQFYLFKVTMQIRQFIKRKVCYLLNVKN